MNIRISRSTLFLTELIIDLFVFAVCAAVCVGLLMRANAKMGESTKLTQAVYIAQTVAESALGEGEYAFSADGTVVKGEGAYTAICTSAGDTVTIEVLAGDESVYTLRAALEVDG